MIAFRFALLLALWPRPATPQVSDKVDQQKMWLMASQDRADELDDLFESPAKAFYFDQINWRDTVGWTALRASVHFGKYECTKVLLERGAHVDTADDKGHTPLMGALYALEEPAIEPMVRLLLRYGANATRRDNSDTSPLMQATHRVRCVRCTALLQDSVERGRLKEHRKLQPALQRLLQRVDPENGQYGGEMAQRMLDAGVLTVHAAIERSADQLQEVTGLSSGRVTALQAAARIEAQKVVDAAQQYATRLADVKEMVVREFWELIVRIHVVDDLVDIIEREPFGKKIIGVNDFLGLSYGAAIRLGIEPRVIREMAAEVKAMDERSKQKRRRRPAGFDEFPGELSIDKIESPPLREEL